MTRLRLRRAPPLLIPLLAVLLAAGCAPSPVGRGPLSTGAVSPAAIPLDVASALYRNPSGSGRVIRITASFPRSRLLFRREASGTATPVWTALYEWGVIIRDPRERQVGGGSYAREVRLPDGAEPGDPEARIHLQEIFPIPGGRYRIEITLADRGSLRAGRFEETVLVETVRDGEPGLSDLEILDPSPEPVAILPSSGPPALQEGELLAGARTKEDAGSIAFLFEGYDPPPGSRVTYRLIDPGGTVVRSRERSLPAGPRLAVWDTLHIGGVPEGSYELEVALPTVGVRGVRSRRNLRVLRPLLADGRDLEETLGQMELYAGPEVVRRFRMLEESGRLALVDSVWGSLDPTPGTERNEAKEEFVRRLRHVDERWGRPRRPGWETVAGRVYVAFGEPDESTEERTTYPARGALEEPRNVLLQRWVYRDPAVVFVFVVENDGSWSLLREASTAPPPTGA